VPAGVRFSGYDAHDRSTDMSAGTSLREPPVRLSQPKQLPGRILFHPGALVAGAQRVRTWQEACIAAVQLGSESVLGQEV